MSAACVTPAQSIWCRSDASRAGSDYLGNPKIDRYCFLTSDSDFTVIGDRLRKYGKEVWLVCRKKDKDRAILAKAFDTLLFLEDFAKAKIRTFDDAIENLFVKALRNIDRNKLPINVSTANIKMKEIDPSFDVAHTQYKNFMPLVKEMTTGNKCEDSKSRGMAKVSRPAETPD